MTRNPPRIDLGFDALPVVHIQVRSSASIGTPTRAYALRRSLLGQAQGIQLALLQRSVIRSSRFASILCSLGAFPQTTEIKRGAETALHLRKFSEYATVCSYIVDLG